MPAFKCGYPGQPSIGALGVRGQVMAQAAYSQGVSVLPAPWKLVHECWCPPTLCSVCDIWSTCVYRCTHGVYVEVRGRLWVSSGVSLFRKLLECLISQSIAGVTCMHSCARLFYTGTGDSNSGPCACRANTVTHRAASPASLFHLLIGQTDCMRVTRETSV